MMDFETWLLKKQKTTLKWFTTMIEDKKPYYDKYDEYKCRAARFEAEVTLRDCRETAKELVALG